MLSYIHRQVEHNIVQTAYSLELVWNNIEKFQGFSGLTGTQMYAQTQYVLYNQFPGMR